VENQRATIFVFLAAGIAGGVFVWQAAIATMTFAVLEDPSLGGVINTSGLMGLVAAAVTFFALLRLPRPRQFVDAVWVQLFAASWPSREETVNNTGVVVGATIFFSALLSVYDLLWGRITDYFLYSA
jgi:preprotein translocase SecE subunit